jgi:hypothetical protein
MKLCRFDDDRLGLVQGDELVDVTAAIEALAPRRWPAPPGDAPQGAGGQSLEDRQRADQLPGAQSATPASPRREIKTIGDWGLFLKSSSSLIGPGRISACASRAGATTMKSSSLW